MMNLTHKGGNSVGMLLTLGYLLASMMVFHK